MKGLMAAGMTDAVRTIHDRYGKMLCIGDGNDYVWNVDHMVLLFTPFIFLVIVSHLQAKSTYRDRR